MNLKNFLEQIDIEQIYQHILKLEYVKDPIDTFDKLNEAADYIKSKFEQYELKVQEHVFKVEGFEGEFRNIEGYIGHGRSPELLIVSHYDTVANCPGANDNGTGISVMLEAARNFAQVETKRNLRFICFSLEEFNPTIELKKREISRKYGIIDKYNRPTSLKTSKLMKKFRHIYGSFMDKGDILPSALIKATRELELDLTESELNYFQELSKLYEIVTTHATTGKTGIMGSSAWVNDNLNNQKEIIGVMDLDSVGYTSKDKFSQKLPLGLKYKPFPNYKINQKQSVGDFLTIIGDKNSGRIADIFCEQCRLDYIDLGYVRIQPSLSFDQMAKNLNQLLWADHAPFWQKEIPGLFLTDTGNLRTPYEHIPADTIDKLDFEFIEKVCKATIATAFKLTINEN